MDEIGWRQIEFGGGIVLAAIALIWPAPPILVTGPLLLVGIALSVDGLSRVLKHRKAKVEKTADLAVELAKQDRLTRKRELGHIETMTKIAQPTLSDVGNPRVLPDHIRADFKASDRLDVFSLREAAHYWAEERPTDDKAPMSHFAEVVMRELVEAGNKGTLIVEPVPEPKGDLAKMTYMARLASYQVQGITPPKALSDSKVLRKNLRAYAESKPERPLFLFPEDR